MHIIFICPPAMCTYRTLELYLNKSAAVTGKKKLWIIESLEEMLIASNQGPQDLVKDSLECI